MTWGAIRLDELNVLIARQLSECSESNHDYFTRVRTEPARWELSPWGDEGGGFWAVAVDGNRVLWYNDIEEGFNVSTFVAQGRIPDEEYWCNQDSLQVALRQLRGEPGWRRGPPRPLERWPMG